MFIMVWNVCDERFMIMEWLWITPAPNLSSSGVMILPLARMERGFVSKSGAGDAEFGVFRLKSLGVHGLKRMS